MKFRVPLAIMIGAALFLGACGGESDQEKAQKALADLMEQASKDMQQSGLDVGKSDSNDNSDSNNKGDSGDKNDSSKTDSNNKSDDNGKSSTPLNPGFANMGECFEVSMTYAALGLSSLGALMGSEMSSSDMKELQDSISELTAKLPKEIQSDFAVVADAYNVAAKEGFASKKAQDALSTDKFSKADERVSDYIENLCG